MGLCRKYVVQQLAARMRPQLEAVVKQNESAAGDTFVPGDFNQVHLIRPSHSALTVHVHFCQCREHSQYAGLCSHLLEPSLLFGLQHQSWRRNHVSM